VESGAAATTSIVSLGNVFFNEPTYDGTLSYYSRSNDRQHTCTNPLENISGCPGEAFAPTTDYPEPNGPSAAQIDAAIALLRQLPPQPYDEPGVLGSPGTLAVHNVGLFCNTFGLTLAGGIPSNPTTLQATVVNPHRIDLAWTDNSDSEDRFVIERSLTAGSGFVQIATRPPTRRRTPTPPSPTERRTTTAWPPSATDRHSAYTN